MCSIKQNNLQPLPKLPKECTYCDDPEWTCAICLEDAGPTYIISYKGKELFMGNTVTQLVTSCGHMFHRNCLENYTFIKTNGNGAGVIPCPYCRTDVFMDSENGKQSFEWWNECDCCTRHMKNRPSSYAYNEDIDNFRNSKDQEEARACLYTEEYSVWCKNNKIRRIRDRANCECPCRHKMRELVRRIPPP